MGSGFTTRAAMTRGVALPLLATAILVAFRGAAWKTRLRAAICAAWRGRRYRIPVPFRHRALSRFIGGLALLLLTVPSIAQFRPVPGREYREFYNPVNPVRGEAVVGLAVVPTEAAQRAGFVQVFLQQPFSGEILVETATADGRFRGEGLYTGSSKGKEWVSLAVTPLSTPGAKEAPSRPASPTLLSVAARGPGGALYVVRWGEAPPPGSSEQLRLYVNSRRGEMFVRSGAKVVRCAAIGVPQLVRFDTFCDLALSDVQGNGLVTLIRRDQFEEQTQAINVALP